MTLPGTRPVTEAPKRPIVWTLLAVFSLAPYFLYQCWWLYKGTSEEKALAWVSGPALSIVAILGLGVLLLASLATPSKHAGLVTGLGLIGFGLADAMADQVYVYIWESERGETLSTLAKMADSVTGNVTFVLGGFLVGARSERSLGRALGLAGGVFLSLAVLVRIGAGLYAVFSASSFSLPLAIHRSLAVLVTLLPLVAVLAARLLSPRAGQLSMYAVPFSWFLLLPIKGFFRNWGSWESAGAASRMFDEPFSRIVQPLCIDFFGATLTFCFLFFSLGVIVARYGNMNDAATRPT